ncbi:MAG: hypothetical protein ACI9RZ_002210, partial [Sphingobacteriales bacterium]
VLNLNSQLLLNQTSCYHYFSCAILDHLLMRIGIK